MGGPGRLAEAASVVAAALATAGSLLAGFLLMDRVVGLWAFVAGAFGLAAALHTVVGLVAPRPGWAMATPVPVLFAGLALAFAGELAEPSEQGGTVGPWGVVLLLGVPAVGVGAAFAGCIAAGAGIRDLLQRHRGHRLPPYP